MPNHLHGERLNTYMQDV